MIPPRVRDAAAAAAADVTAILKYNEIYLILLLKMNSNPFSKSLPDSTISRNTSSAALHYLIAGWFCYVVLLLLPLNSTFVYFGNMLFLSQFYLSIEGEIRQILQQSTPETMPEIIL